MKNYSISEFSGVSRNETDVLSRVGIQSNIDFFCSGVAHIHQKIKSQMPFARLKELGGIIGLTVVDSLNPTNAGLLYKSGITSVNELQNLSLQGLSERISGTDESLNVRILKEATACARSTLTFGKICGVARKPLANATVRIENFTTTTNSNGFFLLSGLCAWDTKMEVECAGYLKLWTSFQAKNQEQKMNVFMRLSPTEKKSSLFVDEWVGGTFRRTLNDITQYRDVQINELPENTPLSLYNVGRYQDGQVRLVSLFKTKEGLDVTLFRVKVPTSALSNPKDGMVYFTKGGQIVGGEKTKKEFWKEFAMKRLSMPAKYIEKVG